MGTISFDSLCPVLTEADKRAIQIKYDISKAIYKKRKQLGKSQKEFADFLCVSQGMVSKWENFDYNYTIESLANICDKLKIRLEVILNSEIEQYSCIEYTNDNQSYNEWDINILEEAG